jgi:cellulose synthase/poly-beta-1,6-N-acetylglucosamine synthase-like glycosyltransferase
MRRTFGGDKQARARTASARRRQWGSDRRERALPLVSKPATNGALGAARVAILVTFVGWCAFAAATVHRAFSYRAFDARALLDAALYMVVVTLLTASALAYLVARLGFLYRTRLHQRTPRAVLDAFFDSGAPSVTALVPSYREETSVIRQTLLSIALQEYADLRVVLLIDDPPHPSEPHDRELLEAARLLPAEIERLFAAPGRRFSNALAAFETRVRSGAAAATAAELTTLAGHYDAAAVHVRELTAAVCGDDHSADFVEREVIVRLAEEFETVAKALRAAAADRAEIGAQRLVQLYRRLSWTFTVRVTSFERKRFLSLSDEPNKAMNLNSYIGLMGGSYREAQTARGPLLLPAAGADADLVVPEADYVLTLDADSVLLPEYCLRLVYLLEQPEYERVAVAQTPYSAFPGATTRIERIAGATTDLQHIVHQGLTHHRATFWVGANAVLRKRALDEIATTERFGGKTIRRYVQDRTVIEDTESTIDLALGGWSLYNYPERLSYSATPPDFGSLSIQRQRWANGGLLILGKLWRYAGVRRNRPARERGLTELFLRINYLASISWSSLGLIVLLAYPINATLLTPIALATALPYFGAMASDLKRCGYKRSDVLRIYAFNLLLLPVNFVGTLKSIGQAISGQKIAFARTPKVRSRTVAPLTFVSAPYLIVGFALLTGWLDVRHHHYAHAGYAAVNAVLCAYALVAFVGIRNSIVDLWVNAVQYLYRPRDDGADRTDEELDWATVLFAGASEGPHGLPVPSAPTLTAFSGQLGAAEVEAEPSPDAPETANVLAEHVRDLLARGRLVLHVDGRALELTGKPLVEARADGGA